MQQRAGAVCVGGNVWCRRGDLNPHALTGASPSSWCVCLFRHFDVDCQATYEPDGTQRSVLKEECERNHCEQPHCCENRGDLVEILLSRR